MSGCGRIFVCFYYFLRHIYSYKIIISNFCKFPCINYSKKYRQFNGKRSESCKFIGTVEIEMNKVVNQATFVL